MAAWAQMLERIKSFVTVQWQTPAILIRMRAALEPYVAHLKQRLTPHWVRGRSWYEKREPREKLLLQVLGSLLALLFVYNILYLPVVNLRADLADRVNRRRQDLIEVRTMMRTYERLQSETTQTEKRTVPGRDFSLFSVVEQALTKSVGHDKIGSITPSDHAVPGGLTQYAVDVKLTNITIAQAVDALYGVQTLSIPVTVSKLEMREQGVDSHFFDIDMTCSALGKQS